MRENPQVAIVGAGPAGLSAAAVLARCGAQVTVYDENDRPGGQLFKQIHKFFGSGHHGAGVPILTGHTVLEARGRDSVEEVTIGRVDERYRPIPGTERTIEADTVCLAVGLTPSIELLRMANVGLTYLPPMGGYLPLHSGTLCTTNPDIYVAGDVAGIEEASTAMEEGRLAGTAIAAALGLLEEAEAGRQMEEIRRRAAQLRTGPHGEARGAAKAELERRYVQWQNS